LSAAGRRSGTVYHHASSSRFLVNGSLPTTRFVGQVSGDGAGFMPRKHEGVMMESEWQAAFTLRYEWQEMSPDPVPGGEGVIRYDAGRGAYALHNDYAGQERRLDYLLDEQQGKAWVSELRDGQRSCSVHRTDRRVEMNRHLLDGREVGSSIVQRQPVRLVAYQEAGDHDRWLWFVDARGMPRRFLVWTHHGRILVLHDVIAFEPGAVFPAEAFTPAPEWGCTEC